MGDVKKLCRGCGDTKLLEEFAKDKSKPDGRHSRCLKCKDKLRKPRATVTALPQEEQSEPKPVEDWRTRARREAVLELLRCHRIEFQELIERHQRRLRPRGEPVWRPADQAIS